MRKPIAAAALLAALAAPAMAQTGTTTSPGATGTATTRPADRDEGFDWGLLGLLGLAGLAPLFMRKDRAGNVHADAPRPRV
jgi:hypothetical protein